MPTCGFCQRRRGCKRKNAGRNLPAAAFDASGKKQVSASDRCRDHFDCWNSAAVARRNGSSTHCVAGVAGPAPRRERRGGWLRMRRRDPGWQGVWLPAHRNYACCCTACPMVVAPALVGSKSGCYSTVPAQPAAVMDNNWLMAAGVAFGFGLERRDCSAAAAVQQVVFEASANCCSVAGNDYVPETRVAAGDRRSACCHRD